VARQAAGLIGLTAAELAARFGPPRFEVREGPGLKLQYGSAACVLDAYLYPPARGGAERVTHVDTRTPAGTDTAQAGCVAALTRTPAP
jgi:hypothetical protein